MEAFYTFKDMNRTDTHNVPKTKVNKKKWFRFAVLSALLISSFMFGAFMDVLADSNTITEYSNPEQNIDVKEIVTIDVEQGDTLWKIAQTYAPKGTDARTYLNQIKNENNLNDHLIYEGQLLKLP